MSGDTSLNTPRSLTEILRNAPTDKIQNGFADFYDEIFEGIREEVAHVLEIGIAVGGSLQGWLEFFPNAFIYAIDINPECVRQIEHPVFSGHLDRLTVGEVDAGHEYKLRDWLDHINDSFDVVIDDGSHLNSDIMTAWRVLWPRVSHGGFYIIEDTQVPESRPLEFFSKDVLYFVELKEPPCIMLRKKGTRDGIFRFN